MSPLVKKKIKFFALLPFQCWELKNQTSARV